MAVRDLLIRDEAGERAVVSPANLNFSCVSHNEKYFPKISYGSYF